MYRQGVMLFHSDSRGRSLIGAVELCDECGQPTPSPHRHLSAEVESALLEMQRRAEPKSSPVGAREHLTLRQLADYSGRSTRWLRARTKDHRDPLPCAKPHGGKLTFRRSDYDRWIERRRPDATVTVVANVLSRLGRRKS